MIRGNWRLKNKEENSDVVIIINKPVFRAGRNNDAEIICRSGLVSKQHANFFFLADGSFAVQDNKSLNGTFVNYQKIPCSEPVRLKHGDIVSLGVHPRTNCKDVTPTQRPFYIFEVLYQDLPDSEEIIEIDSDQESPIVSQENNGNKENANTTNSSGNNNENATVSNDLKDNKVNGKILNNSNNNSDRPNSRDNKQTNQTCHENNSSTRNVKQENCRKEMELDEHKNLYNTQDLLGILDDQLSCSEINSFNQTKTQTKVHKTEANFSPPEISLQLKNDSSKARAEMETDVKSLKKTFGTSEKDSGNLTKNTRIRSPVNENPVVQQNCNDSKTNSLSISKQETENNFDKNVRTPKTICDASGKDSYSCIMSCSDFQNIHKVIETKLCLTLNSIKKYSNSPFKTSSSLDDDASRHKTQTDLDKKVRILEKRFDASEKDFGPSCSSEKQTNLNNKSSDFENSRKYIETNITKNDSNSLLKTSSSVDDDTSTREIQKDLDKNVKTLKKPDASKKDSDPYAASRSSDKQTDLNRQSSDLQNSHKYIETKLSITHNSRKNLSLNDDTLRQEAQKDLDKNVKIRKKILDTGNLETKRSTPTSSDLDENILDKNDGISKKTLKNIKSRTPPSSSEEEIESCRKKVVRRMKSCKDNNTKSSLAHSYAENNLRTKLKTSSSVENNTSRQETKSSRSKIDSDGPRKKSRTPSSSSEEEIESDRKKFVRRTKLKTSSSVENNTSRQETKSSRSKIDSDGPRKKSRTPPSSSEEEIESDRKKFVRRKSCNYDKTEKKLYCKVRTSLNIKDDTTHKNVGKKNGTVKNTSSGSKKDSDDLRTKSRTPSSSSERDLESDRKKIVRRKSCNDDKTEKSSIFKLRISPSMEDDKDDGNLKKTSKSSENLRKQFCTPSSLSESCKEHKTKPPLKHSHAENSSNTLDKSDKTLKTDLANLKAKYRTLSSSSEKEVDLDQRNGDSRKSHSNLKTRSSLKHSATESDAVTNTKYSSNTENITSVADTAPQGSLNKMKMKSQNLPSESHPLPEMTFSMNPSASEIKISHKSLNDLQTKGSHQDQLNNNLQTNTSVSEISQKRRNSEEESNNLRKKSRTLSVTSTASETDNVTKEKYAIDQKVEKNLPQTDQTKSLTLSDDSRFQLDMQLQATECEVNFEISTTKTRVADGNFVTSTPNPKLMKSTQNRDDDKNKSDDTSEQNESGINIKQEVNSQTGFSCVNDYILIDDSEEDSDLPCSQLLQPSSPHPENTGNEAQGIDDSMFSTIKKELEELDQIDIEPFPVVVDSDDFDSDWCTELTEDNMKPDTYNKFKNIDNINNVDIIYYNDIPSGDSMNEQQEPLSQDTSDRLIIDEVVSSNKTVLEKDGKQDEESDPNISPKFKFPAAVKRRPSAPPIIEPHVENQRVIKTKEKKAKKESPKPKKKRGRKKKESCDDASPVRNKSKMQTRSRTGSLLNSQEKVHRRQKLKEIAIKSAEAKENAIIAKNSAVKVKVSDSRGNFLLEDSGPPAKKLKNINKKAIPKSSNEPTTSNKDRKLSSATVSFDVNSAEKQLENPISVKVGDNKQACIQLDKYAQYGMNYYVNNGKTPRQQQQQQQQPPQQQQQPPQQLLSMLAVKHCTEVSDIIDQILHWSVNWLEQQKNNSHSPPVNRHTAVKMCKNFSSYSDYYNVVVPLLMLELWSALYKDWETTSKTDPRKKLIVSRIRREQKLGSYSEVTCATYINKQQNDKGLFIKEDDLVVFECKVEQNSQSCINTGFGFVKSIRKIPTQAKDKIDIKVAELQTVSPDYIIYFNLRTKLFKDLVIKDGRMMFIKVVSSMGPYLRLFKSVKYLELSPLCPLVLHPRIEDYVIPDNYNELITKVNLNRNQHRAVKEAVSLCLSDRQGIYLVEGPPGTGKTKVIVTIIQEILFTNQDTVSCILLVAPSNGAVDELARRLMKLRSKMTAPDRKRFNLVRVGPQKSIHPDVYPCSLTYLKAKNLPMELSYLHPQLADACMKKQRAIDILERDIKGLKEQGKDTTAQERNLEYARTDFDEFCKKEMGDLYRKYSAVAEEKLLAKAHIICTTLSSCFHQRMEEISKYSSGKFTCCIVDEATQSNEQETLIPLMLGIKKLILVGDPQQLPATTLSREAKDLGYGLSLFSRIKGHFEGHADNPIVMLDMQYRMNPEIASFPNRAYYNNRLVNSKLCGTGLGMLKRLKPYVVFNMPMFVPGQQYQNDNEVELVVKLIECILSISCNIDNLDIGIITPYNNQKDKINEALLVKSFRKGIQITVNTVDSFQGQEKDIIIMSCVRMNGNSFINDRHRMNVALTRAKYAMYIVGSTYLFNTSEVLKDIATDADRRGMLCNVESMDLIYLKRVIFCTN